MQNKWQLHMKCIVILQFSSSASGLTPPATPPHQMWKPLAPMALLGKNKAAESSKSPSKIIQIEARPLPSVKHRGKPTANATPIPAALACLDHDYCLPVKGASTGEAVKRWNVKQQSFITIKPIKTADVTNSATPRSAPEALIQAVTKTLSEPLDHRTDRMERTSVLETPDASPARQENEDAVKDVNPRKEPSGRSYRWHSASGTPSPRSSPKERTGGRCRKRSHRSPSPESSGSESYSHSSRSRSRSHSPSKKRSGQKQLCFVQYLKDYSRCNIHMPSSPLKVSASTLPEKFQLLFPFLLSVLSLCVPLTSKEEKIFLFFLSFWLLESLQIAVSISSNTSTVE